MPHIPIKKTAYRENWSIYTKGKKTDVKAFLSVHWLLHIYTGMLWTCHKYFNVTPRNKMEC